MMTGSPSRGMISSGRCFKCKKKKLILMDCSCAYQFCIECRFPEVHMCSVDYIEKTKEKLLKENPIVVAEKVLKI